jgi:putative transcriptional regulator
MFIGNRPSRLSARSPQSHCIQPDGVYTNGGYSQHGICAYPLVVYNRAMIEMRIVELLAERGQSLYWLAKEADIRYSTVHDLSRGKWQAVKRSVIESLCETLECEPGDLIVRTKKHASKRR